MSEDSFELNVNNVKNVLLTCKDDADRLLFSDMLDKWSEQITDTDIKDKLKIINDNDYVPLVYNDYTNATGDEKSEWLLWINVTKVPYIKNKYDTTGTPDIIFQVAIKIVHKLSDETLNVLSHMTNKEIETILNKARRNNRIAVEFTDDTSIIDIAIPIASARNLKEQLLMFVKYVLSVNLITYRDIMNEINSHKYSTVDIRLITLHSIQKQFIKDKYNGDTNTSNALTVALDAGADSAIVEEYTDYLNDLINIPGIVILDIANWNTSANVFNFYLNFLSSLEDDRLTTLFYDSTVVMPEDKNLLYKNQKYMEVLKALRVKYVLDKAKTEEEIQKAVSDYQEFVYSLVAQGLNRKEQLEEKDTD